MNDIVLVEGNNELNIQMVPIGGVAQFIYASDIRQQDWAYGAGGIKFEVDIQNTGGQPANCTAVATIDTCYGGQEVSMGTQSIAPGEIKTFFGQWYWPYAPTLEPDEWWRPIFIKSEAGTIFFGLPRAGEPYLISMSIPPTKAAHGFMPSVKLYLPPGRCYWFYAYVPKEYLPVGTGRSGGWPPARGCYVFLEWRAGECYAETPHQKAETLPLNSPDNIYNIEGCLTLLSEEPEGGTWGVGECLPMGEGNSLWIPPGAYPVYYQLYIRAPEGNYPYSSGKQVAVLNLELADWFEFSNLKYPASARDGSTITISVDVTNTGVAPGIREIEWRTNIAASGGGWVRARETISLSPGETKTSRFIIQIPSNFRYSGFSFSFEIEGFGPGGHYRIYTS